MDVKRAPKPGVIANPDEAQRIRSILLHYRNAYPDSEPISFKTSPKTGRILFEADQVRALHGIVDWRLQRLSTITSPFDEAVVTAADRQTHYRTGRVLGVERMQAKAFLEAELQTELRETAGISEELGRCLGLLSVSAATYSQ